MPNQAIEHLLHDMRQHVKASGEGDDIEEKWYEHIVGLIEQTEQLAEQRADARITAANNLLAQTVRALKTLTEAIEGVTDTGER